MKFLYLFLFFVLMVCGENLYAQQDPHFSQYFLTPLFYNPASTGVERVTRFSLLYRNQWTGYQPTSGSGGAPSTQLFSVQSRAFTKIGIGGFVYNDQLGPVNNIEANVSGAYHLSINKKSKISIGLQAGILNQGIRQNLFKANDPDDPLLQGGSLTKPDLHAGIMYSRENFSMSVAARHLLTPTFDFGNVSNGKFVRHYYTQANYEYDVNFSTRVVFSGLLKTDLYSTSFDLSAIAYFKNLVWGGLSFRQSEAVILLLGYSLMKNKELKIGYGLDYVVKDKAAKKGTSHEISISYEIPVLSTERKPVRTPRFRF